MVKKMIDEDMLAPIDYNNIPNIKNLDPAFTNLSYDPEGAYSVPYLWQTVGILYDIDQTGRELTSMKDMFDPAYARKVCMLDSIRDTIGMTLKMQGYSMNDTDPAHVAEVRDILLEQKPNVLAYGTDELPAKVLGGTAAMARYIRAKQFAQLKSSQRICVLRFRRKAATFAIDAFAILKTSKNKEAAEKFINFMLGRTLRSKTRKKPAIRRQILRQRSCSTTRLKTTRTAIRRRRCSINVKYLRPCQPIIQIILKLGI